ncbi:SAM-dependent methyltransferase [Kutzneria albida]|uniref:S-adenosyl methyltransferase n=1 Tax=Kutzneria albida DSM 43870 TaxID=1449976 RepID=W5WHG4_9PSEU|nr:SAM-dependent methyltransferase [Kutzneria albida]AHI00619.1 hypothetical protein KALB_7261 [Kutzneria albida DSM 43870]
MHRPRWVPADVDLDRPNAARIFDYFLGGAHNFAVDRRAAKDALSGMPEVAAAMRASRSFLRRAVTHLADAGVDQFLDLGSGIPTVGNVHEIVHRINPGARVVYVDNDPVAVAHSRTILGDNPLACAIRADVRQVDTILGSPEVERMLDLERPIGLIMVGVLHFLPDEDDPVALVDRYRRALAQGSYLALSHATADFVADHDAAQLRALGELYRQTLTPVHPRTVEEIAKLFAGFDLVEPGIVPVRQWHSEWVERNEGTIHLAYGGVARRP